MELFISICLLPLKRIWNFPAAGTESENITIGQWKILSEIIFPLEEIKKVAVGLFLNIESILLMLFIQVKWLI